MPRAPVSVDVRRQGKAEEDPLLLVDALLLLIMIGVVIHGVRSEIASPKNILLFLALGVTCVPAGVGYLWLWGVKDPLRFLELGEYTPGRGLILLGYMSLAIALIGSLLAGIGITMRAYRNWRRNGA